MAALSPKALIDLSTARSYVLRDETDGTKDDLLALLINSVSRRVRRYTKREFFTTDAEERLFTYDGNGVLNLEPFELRAVSSIIVSQKGTVTPTTLTTDDYTLEPQTKTDEQTYWWLRMPQIDNPGAYPASSRVGFMSTVAVTGDWGIEVANWPEDLQEAVLITVDWRYKNPAASRQIQVGNLQQDAYGSSSDRDVSEFPPEALAILDDIARPESLT